MDSAKMPRILKEIEVVKSTTTFNPDRDRERKEKLNMRKLKTLSKSIKTISNYPSINKIFTKLADRGALY